MNIIKNNRPIVNEINTAFRQMEKRCIVRYIRMNTNTRNSILNEANIITSIADEETLWTAYIIIDENLKDRELVLLNKDMDYTFNFVLP